MIIFCFYKRSDILFQNARANNFGIKERSLKSGVASSKGSWPLVSKDDEVWKGNPLQARECPAWLGWKKKKLPQASLWAQPTQVTSPSKSKSLPGLDSLTRWNSRIHVRTPAPQRENWEKKHFPFLSFLWRPRRFDENHSRFRSNSDSRAGTPLGGGREKSSGETENERQILGLIKTTGRGKWRIRTLFLFSVSIKCRSCQLAFVGFSHLSFFLLVSLSPLISDWQKGPLKDREVEILFFGFN